MTAGGAQYVYDALNRRVRVQTASATNEYVFDAAGQRVSTWAAANNVGTEGRIYWGAQQIAYRAADGTTYFDHKDWLGTERMRTTYTGAVASSYTSLPWGDAYTANETNSNGNAQDNSHFALLDHDNESNTDHAQFRQFSNIQGRWMSPDPYDRSYNFKNPQSFNRYSYASNNPLRLRDTSGLDEVDSQDGDSGPCGVTITCFADPLQDDGFGSVGGGGGGDGTGDSGTGDQGTGDQGASDQGASDQGASDQGASDQGSGQQPNPLENLGLSFQTPSIGGLQRVCTSYCDGGYTACKVAAALTEGMTNAADSLEGIFGGVVRGATTATSKVVTQDSCALGRAACYVERCGAQI